jgi:hypothetical protein
MRIFGFLLSLLVGAQLAHAQDFEAAAKHFSLAQDAFGKQHFHTAAAEFQLAYDITKDPVLLYNIGEAWQKAGDGRKAVASYKAYLKAQPTAQDRADVQKRVKMIEQKKFKIPDQSAPGDVPAPAAPAPAAPPATPPATAAPPDKAVLPTPDFNAPTQAPPPEPATPATTTAPPTSAPPPAPAAAPPPATTALPAEPAPLAPAPAPVAAPEKPAPEPSSGLLEDQPVSRMRVAAWIGVAATVAVLTAGAIFGLAAQSRADEISRRFIFVDSTGQPRQFDAAQQKDYNNLKDEGELYNGLAIGFFAGAGALAITTTVLFIVDAKRPARQAWHVAPTFGPGQGGLAASWSF